MRVTGLDLLRRMVARLRMLRVLRRERATAPRATAAYRGPDPSPSDAIIAARLCEVMQRAGIAEPEELKLLAMARYLTNADVARLVRGLEDIDNSFFAGDALDDLD